MHPFCYPLIAVVLWAGNTLVGKVSAEVISPAAISFYRWALAALILTPFILPQVWRLRRVVTANLLKLSVLAGLGIVAFQSLAYVAAASTSATNMGLIGATVPLITMVFSTLILRDAPTLGGLFGALISFTGLAILLSGGDLAGLSSQGVNRGDLLLLAGASAYALYGVLIRRWVIPLNLWQSLYVQILFGLVWLSPAALLSPSMAVSNEALPLVLFAGIAASIVAPYCWMKGIDILGANNTTIFMNLVPLMTTASAVVLLGEQLSWAHGVGGSLILSGVLLAQLWRRALPSLRPQPAD
ncbi:DMT family transporter [Ferrimonas marina]|uniref:Permease of the drug/metabolite transporter (DMT) superfamily n=1 Tax=Ferrimonas marina TaxID=299255 RepID=A0A1M5Z482_9GAMM|nr:DMT family transporter [Ferrimonas marina]SHI19030.1 Permease of the drug/metabolite transporter (DMT) superfamily [Ferrimonas marina]